MNRIFSHLFNRIFQSRLLFSITLMVVFYGLFLKPNSPHTDRLMGEITNLGHMGAFLVIWTFVFNIFPRFTRLSKVKLLLVVMITTLIIGELIEFIQGLIGRDDEWQDVWDDGVGALLAISFCSSQVRELARWPRFNWRVLALILLLLVPWPIWCALSDEVILRNQFPVLADFTTPYETGRWITSNARKTELRMKSTGKRYLRVEFRPGNNSTVSLKYFYPDWHGYKRIILHVRNPDAHEYHLVLQMHDRLDQENHCASGDCFNHLIVIKHGQQQISIPLEMLRDSPRTRELDLRHMEDFSLATRNSKMYHHLDILRVALDKT